MLTTDLDTIIARLSETIPKAWAPPPKPQASWRTLKIGNTLERTGHGHVWNIEVGTVSPGKTVTIKAVDSQGVHLEADDGKVFSWGNPEWKLYWTRVKRQRRTES